MYYERNSHLFSDGDLYSVLRNQELKIQEYIKKMPLQHVLETEESSLIEEVINKFKITTPTLINEKIVINPVEAEVEITRRNRELYDGEGPIYKNGLHITVQIPFSGEGDLFKFRASTFTFSGTPNGEIQGNTLILIYETIEKDQEKIKELWNGDIRRINENLSWIRKDVEEFNNKLKSIATPSIAVRKKETGENKSLIDALKK